MIYLSIVIPVRNEEKYIGDTLRMLINQDYPKERFELLVVDGMSTDSTRSVVEKFIKENPNANILLLDNPGQLSSRARNIGIREARGQLIGIIDGHVYVPNNQLFTNMECLIKENRALCLARPAPLDVPGLTDGKAYWIAVARKTWLGHSRNSFIYSDFEGFVDPMSSGFAYDKSLFEKVGYFDESFDAAEDVEFHFRLKKEGISAYTAPDLLIYSYPRESFKSLFKQQMRYGEGRARLVRKHHDAFTKETPIPSFIFVFFVMSLFALLCFWHFPFISATYAAAMVLFLFILFVTGFLEAIIRKRFFPGILISFGIWTTNMGLGWGFLKTVCFPKKLKYGSEMGNGVKG